MTNYNLNGKVNHCLYIHKLSLVDDSEPKKGYRYIGYILFLRNEIKTLSLLKETKERKLLIADARDVLNQVCERYITMHGGV